MGCDIHIVLEKKDANENFLAGVDGMSLNNIRNMAAEELTAIRELLTATPPHE